MKMKKKIMECVDRDEFVVGLVGGVREKEMGRHKNMLFGGVYMVHDIRSLVRGHSPGGAKVLLCLISYVLL